MNSRVCERERERDGCCVVSHEKYTPNHHLLDWSLLFHLYSFKLLSRCPHAGFLLSLLPSLPFQLRSWIENQKKKKYLFSFTWPTPLKERLKGHQEKEIDGHSLGSIVAPLRELLDRSNFENLHCRWFSPIFRARVAATRNRAQSESIELRLPSSSCNFFLPQPKKSQFFHFSDSQFHQWEFNRNPNGKRLFPATKYVEHWWRGYGKVCTCSKKPERNEKKVANQVNIHGSRWGGGIDNRKKKRKSRPGNIINLAVHLVRFPHQFGAFAGQSKVINLAVYLFFLLSKCVE